MAGIRLEWAQFGDFDSFDILRSSSPMNIAALPSPIATNLHTMYHVDTTVVEGATYYYRVVAWRDAVSKVSAEAKFKASSGDQHWDKVVALLHFDDDLTDETGRIWNLSGAPIIGGVGQFGGGITFSGDSSERVSSVCPAFGQDDWTAEMWVKFNYTSGQQNFFENLNSSGISPAGRFTIYQANGLLKVFIYSADRIITTTPSDTKYHHLSVSCESGLVRLFLDGNTKGAWDSGGLNFDQTLILFGAGFGTGSLNGSLDELRITKGVARYTDDFTPPNAPFPSYY